MTLTLPRLVAVITVVGIFVMAASLSMDSDTWWHLRTGQWILEHRAVPQTDPFSFTFFGQLWRYPSTGWLSEVTLFVLFERLGFAGPTLWAALCIALAFGLVYYTCPGSAFLRAFVVIFAALIASVFWSVRPQIVSFLFTAIYAYLLNQFRWHQRNHLWLLVPLMLLWANAHGGFAIGFILIGLTLAGQLLTLASRWIEVRVRRMGSIRGGGSMGVTVGDVGWRGAAEYSGAASLVGVGLACALAVMVNPAGPIMLLYPLQTVSISFLRDFINEWQSPNFHEFRPQAFLWLLLGTLAVIALSRRRVNLTDLLLVCGIGYMGFLAGRNVSLLTLIAPPVLTRHLTAIFEDWRARWPAPANVPHSAIAAPPLTPSRAARLNWALLILVLVAAGVRVAVSLPTALPERVKAGLPLGAVQYLQQHRPPGPLFNSYNFGGYLLWALYPDYQIFVDGRTDLYADDFLHQYQAVAMARPGYQATLDQYGIKLVLIEADSLLGDQLQQNPRWHETYRDAVAAVYERVP